MDRGGVESNSLMGMVFPCPFLLDKEILELDGGGIEKYLMPLNCAIENALGGKFYMVQILRNKKKVHEEVWREWRKVLGEWQRGWETHLCPHREDITDTATQTLPLAPRPRVSVSCSHSGLRPRDSGLVHLTGGAESRLSRCARQAAACGLWLLHLVLWESGPPRHERGTLSQTREGR